MCPSSCYAINNIHYTLFLFLEQKVIKKKSMVFVAPNESYVALEVTQNHL